MTHRLLISLALVCALSHSVTAQTLTATKLNLSNFPFITGTSDTTLATVSNSQIPASKAVKIYANRHLGGRPLSTVAPTTGQVIGWNGSTWIPVTPSGGGGGGTVYTTTRLAGDGTPGTPLDIAQQSATTGQVLQWSGTAWVPATPTASKTYEEFDGVSGTTITTANTIPATEKNWRINLYRDGVRLRYLKDYSISGSVFTLYVSATSENFTLIIEN